MDKKFIGIAKFPPNTKNDHKKQIANYHNDG